jgi:DNA-binding FadR family transcriptional regulator
MEVRGMYMDNQATKMYLQIVRELRLLIQSENIKPGGKLPSERDLVERLKVGRSTVREALRSLELLGLIETKRGEGTFLTDFRNHKLVEILSTFILQDMKTINDVHITRQTLEKEAIRIVAGSTILKDLPVWDSLLARLNEEGNVQREDLVREILILSNNRLSLKMWFLLKQYGEEPYVGFSDEEENMYIHSLLQAIKNGEIEQAIQSYNAWTDLLTKRREKV